MRRKSIGYTLALRSGEQQSIRGYRPPAERPMKASKATKSAAPCAAKQKKTARPRRQRSSVQDDISAREAAEILPRSYPTQFNAERERRQLVFDQILGLYPYPSEYLASNLTAETRAAKIAFDQAHHLVVIEWGGTKPPGRTWSYSRRQCSAVAAEGLLAELRARREWGLPSVSKVLGGRRIPRSPSTSDKKSPTLE